MRTWRRYWESHITSNPTGEAFSNPTLTVLKKMYVYFMAQQMDTVFYKFNRSKFMTYNGWTKLYCFGSRGKSVA